MEESQQKWFDALDYAVTSVKHCKRQDFAHNTQQTEKGKGFTNASSFLDELIAKHEAESRAKGRTEGRAEGRTKGRAEGKVKGKAEMIIRILSHRLESPSKPLQKKINSIQNTAKLDKLADFALTCISLDEFAAVLE
jgi:flagellar biosynthesis/type III secretory pathway protein FliH